ncbi:hypothetical protein [Symbioplanes lichenis]|uniref:hypothetical protein n=1 Tax=Symbioplanes lichenis TaxID=1629072 RepID=UPI003F693542
MTMPEMPRAVWRRAAAAEPRESAVDAEPAVCGGRELSVDERYELMKERRRLRKEAEAKEREEAEAKESGRHRSRQSSPDDDEDEDKAAERFRNDRYSVKLLKQDTSAWGGGGAGSGDIG